MGAEACLLVGSIKNAYHTKYLAIYAAVDSLVCETLHKGVFVGGAVFLILSMVGSIAYYWVHSMVDISGWEKLHEESSPLICQESNEN